MTPNVSPCGRFVVIDGLHLDRAVFEVLARWAAGRGLRVQDAIQLALCAFEAQNAAGSARGQGPPPEGRGEAHGPESEGRLG